MHVQKLEELLDMLVPGGRHQHDVTMLEDCLVEACDRARQANSKLGQLLDGPPVQSDGQEQAANLPLLWTHDQLQRKQLAWPLPNQRYLTTSCMQVGPLLRGSIRHVLTLFTFTPPADLHAKRLGQDLRWHNASAVPKCTETRVRWH